MSKLLKSLTLKVQNINQDFNVLNKRQLHRLSVHFIYLETI